MVSAFGPEGLRSISTVASILIILALDEIAKVTYGFIATARFDKLPGAHAHEPGSAA